MILLLSSDGDYSTERIIQWLNYRSYKKYMRLNPLDFIDNQIEIYPGEGQFFFNGKAFRFKDVNVVWYRRFGGYAFSGHYKKVDESIGREAADLLKNELNNITDYFVSLLPKNRVIGSMRNTNTNKLIELYNAKESGLNIPFTFVTSTKKTIERHKSMLPKVISKSVFNARPVKYDTGVYTMYTTQITESDMAVIPDNFFPSLVQEEIIKDYEIRIFYFLGEFFCMAIISQNNPQTQIDFRRYDVHTPNRFVPCEIDNETKEKITIFMNRMGLNTGSLDFVKDKKGTLFFLEVNYMGQFGMVDIPCNYGIHRHIADYLITADQNG